MAIVDAFGNRCDRALRLHFRILHRVSFDVLEQVKHAQKIFGKSWIHLELGSMTCVNMDKRSHARLVIVDSTFSYNTSSPEQTELYERFAAHDDLLSVNVFVVFELKPVGWKLPPHGRIAGSANHVAARPAIFVAADPDGSTLPHELGHILMNTSSDHSEGPNDVMRSGNVRSPMNKTTTAAVFQEAQTELMRKSALLRSC